MEPTQAVATAADERAAEEIEFSDGVTAIVRGALDAGCDFFAGYPITPASGILVQLLHELPRRGGVAIQAEDEIASLGMCLGAAMCGARALTATSGPGISLSSENVGLAIMGEVPVVIVDVQRSGPATGGATSVGQGDVQFVRWGTSGGYPILALAPSTVAECYALTRRAFALAGRFRAPVFLLADKELALTATSVAHHEYDHADEYCRLADEAPLHPLPSTEAGAFRPYRYDPPEAVPALAPLGGDDLVRFTGSSHDERGFLTKDPAQVAALNRHLVAKIEAHAAQIELTRLDAQPGARTLLVSYGVTAGAVRAAARQVRDTGGRVATLTALSLWPLPERALRAAAAGMVRVVVAELNWGDLRREVERLLGASVEVLGANRVDGEALAPEDLVALVV
jgi:2-oxoglutarate ferredoxin oxidoreductase subunit alpha